MTVRSQIRLVLADKPSKCGEMEKEAFYKDVRTSSFGVLKVVEPVLGDIVGEGIIGVGSAQKGLDGKKNSANLKSRCPLILKDVQTDAAELVDVRVIDLRQKANFGGVHGVVLSKEELQFENAT